MLFTRTQRYHSSIPKEVFISRLIGNHVRIHNLDFEVFEKGNSLRIIPHAEQVDSIKTLPITHIDLKNEGDKTDVVITSNMRKLDSGGPLLIVIFCTFLLLASFILLYVGGQLQITYSLLGMSAFIFTVFYVRMQMGYFDYVRKIRDHVKHKLELKDYATA